MLTILRKVQDSHWTPMTVPRLIITFAILLITGQTALSLDYGKYVGTVQAEWLPDGRKMRLLAEFSYVDPKGTKWIAPAGWIVDGASIPQTMWSFSGGPF